MAGPACEISKQQSVSDALVRAIQTRRAEGVNMKKILSFVMSMLLVAIMPLWAAEKSKEEDRLVHSGTVLKEILDIPDDIPESLLGKANCVVVFPSVLK